MIQNIFWPQDEEKTIKFMNEYLPDFKPELGYKKWHYVEGFTKNCIQGSPEHLLDIKLMRDLEESIYKFQNKWYSKVELPEYDENYFRIRLSDKPTIFLYWHQGKELLGDLQKLCYQRLVRLCKKSFNILLLDSKTISDYIDIPVFMTELMLNKSMTLQFYVDYIRTLLLEKYEGIWLDLTVFVRSDFDKIDFNHPFWSIKDVDLFNSWATGVMPTLNGCQAYALSGTSYYFYACIRRLIEYHFRTFGIGYTYFLYYYMAQYLYSSNPLIKDMFDSLPNNNTSCEMLSKARSISMEAVEDIWKNKTDTHLFKVLKFFDTDSVEYKVYEFLKKIDEEESNEYNVS